MKYNVIFEGGFEYVVEMPTAVDAITAASVQFLAENQEYSCAPTLLKIEMVKTQWVKQFEKTISDLLQPNSGGNNEK